MRVERLRKTRYMGRRTTCEWCGKRHNKLYEFYLEFGPRNKYFYEKAFCGLRCFRAYYE